VAAGSGILGQAQLLAHRDAELLADQVDAGGLLGHRVLYLQPGVYLEERHGAVVADEVLDRTGAVVAGLAADGLGRGVDGLALLRGEERRGRLLDQLLVPSLKGAVAGTDDDHIAVLVGEYLSLDVPGLVEVTLHKALAAAERGHRLAGCRLKQIRNLSQGAGDLQAAATTAEGRLDGDREPVLLGEGDHFLGTVDRLSRTGH
jgi:hypothetical protein